MHFLDIERLNTTCIENAVHKLMINNKDKDNHGILNVKEQQKPWYFMLLCSHHNFDIISVNEIEILKSLKIYNN